MPHGLVRRRLSLGELRRYIALPLLRPPAGTSQLDVELLHAKFVATSILGLFFGKAWAVRFAMENSQGSRFLKGRPSDGLMLNMHIARVIELAEFLINFQDILGFDGVIDQIRSGHLESGFAELDAAKLLSRYGIHFSFNTRSGLKGADYDLDIAHPNGALCCGEIKSKTENSTKLTSNTIIKAVKSARDQIPSDRPGILFLRVPQDWLLLNGFEDSFSRFIKAYMPARMTGIVALGTIISHDEGASRRYTTYAAAEFLNNNHRFNRELDWRTISGRPTPRHDPLRWIDLEKLCRALGHSLL